MKQESKVYLINSLIEVIDAWWQGGGGIDDAPIVGDETYYLMAESAVNILCANGDIEDYFKSQDMIKNE